MMAASVALAQVRGWAADLATLPTRLGPRFGRPEPRRWVRAYSEHLLGPVERKNSGQRAEQAGEPTPTGLQRLLAGTKWDADAERDDLRAYALEHLADPEAVLIVDETGFLKKGSKSVGVQRQYSGTTGRAEAGVPEDICFQTKPALARAVLARAFAAGVPAACLAADLIPLTVPEVRRLLWWLVWRALPPKFVLAWSRWRRRHQAQARRCHYQRRLAHLGLQVQL